MQSYNTSRTGTVYASAKSLAVITTSLHIQRRRITTRSDSAAIAMNRVNALQAHPTLCTLSTALQHPLGTAMLCYIEEEPDQVGISPHLARALVWAHQISLTHQIFETRLVYSL